ncbi:MAG: hypothetical protein ACKO96_08780, partial [Flammeovirgaceae bacterium]
MILVPPGIKTNAFVDIEFEHSKDYETKKTTKKSSGTITGLIAIPWSNLIDLPGTAAVEKFGNADEVFSFFKSKYENYDHWAGLELELQNIDPNCPKKNVNNIGQCGNEEEQKEEGCFKPVSSSISKSRTE